MKTKKPKLNVRLLRRIQKQILKEPAQFYMDWWTTDDPSRIGVDKIPNCGTACCIAGWAVALTDGTKPDALKKLGLDVSLKAASAIWGEGASCVTMNTLFCTPRWPARFRDRFDKCATHFARAKVAVARIEHLIKTGK